MTQNIAQEIRQSRGPTREMPELVAQAQRLRLSLEVAEKWRETANKEDAGTLEHHAQYMRDKIEEEYSLVCFEMELLERHRIFSQMALEPNEEPFWSEGEMRASMVSDSLLDAYVIVSQTSEDGRYKVMGALRAAMDLVPEKIPAPSAQGVPEPTV